MSEQINPIIQEMFNQTPLISKSYTIDLWMEKLSVQLVNELLNNVTVIDGPNEVHFICPECGEILDE